MQSFKTFFSSGSPYSYLLLLASALGMAAASIRAFESKETKARRTRLKNQKEVHLLAERISTYGKSVHRRFPTGDVVVSEKDLAEQLRKRQEAVATALNLLLSQQKVQRAPLNGYWKLNP